MKQKQKKYINYIWIAEGMIYIYIYNGFGLRFECFTISGTDVLNVGKKQIKKIGARSIYFCIAIELKK